MVFTKTRHDTMFRQCGSTFQECFILTVKENYKLMLFVLFDALSLFQKSFQS